MRASLNPLLGSHRVRGQCQSGQGISTHEGQCELVHSIFSPSLRNFQPLSGNCCRRTLPNVFKTRQAAPSERFQLLFSKLESKSRCIRFRNHGCCGNAILAASAEPRAPETPASSCRFRPSPESPSRDFGVRCRSS
ncbi:hypothetical protein HMPREF3036_01686 [Sutterella sp. KLE1602]|nr:hypothetical protein HMPREF3036_01686 [Sutterella sp. KLE1602]